MSALNIQFRRDVQFMGNGRPVFLSLTDAFCQQILYLAIHRSKIIFRPVCDGVVEFCRQTQRDLFLAAVCHLVKAAGVDNGLGVPIAAQYYETVRHHGGFTFFIQFHDLLFRKAGQRHFYHADCAVHDHLAGVDYG